MVDESFCDGGAGVGDGSWVGDGAGDGVGLWMGRWLGGEESVWAVGWCEGTDRLGRRVSRSWLRDVIAAGALGGAGVSDANNLWTIHLGEKCVSLQSSFTSPPL